jgi:glycosyltransferase involved in cell wall biosynthesis
VLIDARLMYYRKAGIAQYTRSLVMALAEMGAPGLAVLLDRRDTDTTWLPAGVRVVRAVTPAHHRLEARTLPLELWLANLRSRIALLHSPDFIAPRGRFKKVITIHDLYFMEHPDVMDAAGARYYGQAAQSAARADAIIAVSEFTRREIQRLLPTVPIAKIHVIPEAATQSPRFASNHESLISNLKSPFILFVGTFEPRKNLATLLRALKELPADVRLVMVGEKGWSADASSPARLARELGVSERVTFAGRVDDATLDAYYRNARLLVMPSLSEGFGLPVLEALARGTPVVCSNAGALPDVVGNTALLHDPLDAGALARLVRVMWTSDAVRNDYSRRGQQRAAMFSWANAAQQTWRVYQSCVS